MESYGSVARLEARFAIAWALVVGVLTAASLLLFRPLSQADGVVRFVQQLPAPVIAFFDLGRITTPDGFLDALLFELLVPIAFLSFGIGVGSRAFAPELIRPRVAPSLLLAEPGNAASGHGEAVWKSVAARRRALSSGVAIAAGVSGLAAMLGIALATGATLARLSFNPLHLAAAIAANGLLGIGIGLVALVVSARSGRPRLAAAVATVIAVAADLANGLAPVVPMLRPLRYLSLTYYADGGSPAATGVPISHFAALVAWVVVAALAVAFVVNRQDRLATEPAADNLANARVDDEGLAAGSTSSEGEAVTIHGDVAAAALSDPTATLVAGTATDPAAGADPRGGVADAPRPVEPGDRLGGRAARNWRRAGRQIRVRLPAAAASALAIGFGSAIYVTGFASDFSATLQIMGFDPDRASLIIALLAGAATATVAAFAGSGRRLAVGLGAAGVLVAFYPVFRSETRAAIESRGADGVFDPVGWAGTALALVVAGLLVGWASELLGNDLRRRAIAVKIAATSLLPGRRRHRRSVAALVAAAATLVALVVTLPLVGDMFNFAPDSHMRVGAPQGVGLFGGDGGGAPGAPDGGGSPAPAGAGGGGAGASGSGTKPVTSPSHGILQVPPELIPGPVAGSYVTAGALASGTPWTVHPPTGAGRTMSINLPAPWTGGVRDFATIDIYLPPGYDTGHANYPVIYEPHQPLWAWEQGMHVTSLLDTLITSGAVPAEIVVFVGQYGGPYPDSECADSWDGTEWFDRYLAVQVPQWVDGHLRTIATAAGRALLGFSSGGYCAAAAITHHPDVFATASIFSGYFEAGITSSTTPSAGRPFNNDPALEAKVSPIVLAPRVPTDLRSRMFLTFSADPANRFYANQITEFAGVLSAAGIPMAILPTPLGHSWAAVREQLPVVLKMIAARQLQLGVFTAR